MANRTDLAIARPADRIALADPDQSAALQEVTAMGAQRVLVLSAPGRLPATDSLVAQLAERCVGRLSMRASESSERASERVRAAVGEHAPDLVLAWGEAAIALAKQVAAAANLPVLAVVETLPATDAATAGALPVSAPALPPSAQAGPTYLSGFANTHSSEALPGALPRRQNSPNPTPYGLFPESLNGTPFTAKRTWNQRTWMYRIRPSLLLSAAQPMAHERFVGRFENFQPVTSLRRWRPHPLPAAEQTVDFIDGLSTFGGSGDPDSRLGYAIHLYVSNTDMRDRCLVNNDGHLLLVPELGRLHIRTELGWLHIAPGEIAVVPRGLKFSVQVPDGQARGYVLEVFGNPFQLPERGPVGANGLAATRHFLAPTAAYEDRPCPDYEVVVKQSGVLFRATLQHSPYDVVAWHGTYVPYKYDLSLFQTIGSVSFDHADPSLYTVLTCPLGDDGTSLADFVIFPGRWEVSEHSFRPPYYHRNSSVEFNGIVRLDNPYAGFERGCYFMTPSYAPHGISANGYRNALAAEDRPMRLPDSSLWILIESALGMRVSPWALNAQHADRDFHHLWADMPIGFSAPE